MKKILFLILMFCTQNGYSQFMRMFNYTTAPTGACQFSYMAQNTTDGTLYYCRNGVWTVFTTPDVTAIVGVEPRIKLNETDQTTDEKNWDFDVNSKVFSIRTRTDADGAGVSTLTITRGTGTAASLTTLNGQIFFGADTTFVTADSIRRLSNVIIINGGSSGFNINDSTNTNPLLSVTDGGIFQLNSNRQTGLNNNYSLIIWGSNTSGQSLGLDINAGSTSADINTSFYKSDGSTLLARVQGDGVFRPGSDNIYDFGSSGTRWRTGYFGTSFGIGVTTSPSQTLDVRGTQAGVNVQSTTGTNAAFNSYVNTSGFLYTGVDSSVGGTLLAGSTGYSGIITTTGAQALQLGTNNVLRMTISSAGVATLTGTVFMSGLTTSGSTQTAYICRSAGNELIADSTTCLVSAESFKRDIQPLNSSLDLVLKLKPVTFYYKEPLDNNQAVQQFGFNANLVAEIEPRLVTYSNDGKIRGFRYENYTAILTKAIQELEERVQRLETK